MSSCYVHICNFLWLGRRSFAVLHGTFNCTRMLSLAEGSAPPHNLETSWWTKTSKHRQWGVCLHTGDAQIGFYVIRIRKYKLIIHLEQVSHLQICNLHSPVWVFQIIIISGIPIVVVRSLKCIVCFSSIIFCGCSGSARSRGFSERRFKPSTAPRLCCSAQCVQMITHCHGRFLSQIYKLMILNILSLV